MAKNTTTGIYQGKIKFYNDKKGFGFITDSDDDGKETFFHVTGINKGEEIKKDAIVNYDIRDGRKGEEAHNISIA